MWEEIVRSVGGLVLASGAALCLVCFGYPTWVAGAVAGAIMGICLYWRAS